MSFFCHCKCCNAYLFPFRGGITFANARDLSLFCLTSELSVLSVVVADHTKRSSHKLAASIVVAVAAVAEFRNTRLGSFYSADDFYRGVPSPSVRLLRASYSMTSW